MTTYPPNYRAHPPPPQMRAPASALPPEPGLAHPEQLPRTRRRRSKTAPTGRRGSLSLKLLIAALSVPAIGLGALAVLILVASPGTVLRDKLVENVLAKTGRTIEVRGGISFVASPQPGLMLSNIVIPPPEGMSGADTLQAQKLKLDIAIAPLLKGRIVIEQASLINPVIDLKVDKDGQRSWQTKPRRAAAPAKPRAQQAAIPISRASAGLGAQLLARLGRAEFGLKKLIIRNGKIQYTDIRSDRRHTLAAINLEFSGPRLDGNVAATGSMLWRRELLKLRGQLETLPRLLAHQPVKANLALTGNLASAGFRGDVTFADRVVANGDVGFAAPALDRFLGWQGITLADTAPIGGLQFAGFLAFGDDTLKLASARLSLGKSQASGGVTIKLGGTRPEIAANLQVSQFDVDRLRQLVSATRLASQTTNLGNLRSGVGRFSPRVRGYQAKAGWSAETIDTSALRAVDIVARVAADGLTIGGLEFSRASLHLGLRDGNLRADFDNAVLYDGKLRTIVTAHPTPSSGLSVRVNAFGQGIAARNLLAKLGNFDTVSGRTQIAAKLSAVGTSQLELMSSLAGTAQVSLTDGAIAGWDVEAILNTLRRGKVPELRNIPSEKTRFRELSASFAINQGVAVTRDVRMVSPVFHMNGSGQADLGQQQVDFLTRSKLVAGKRKSRDVQLLKDLELPIRVRGAWRKPSVTLEIENAFRDPARARETLRKARRRFKGRDPKKVVRGILRGGSKNEDLRAAKKILKDLFQ